MPRYVDCAGTPAHALRDFQFWAENTKDPDLQAYAKECADVLIKQGVRPAPQRFEVGHSQPVRSIAGYRGVATLNKFGKRTYQAILLLGNGNAHRKSFKSAEEAAVQFDAWCWEARHDLSQLNFPEMYEKL